MYGFLTGLCLPAQFFFSFLNMISTLSAQIPRLKEWVDIREPTTPSCLSEDSKWVFSVNHQFINWVQMDTDWISCQYNYDLWFCFFLWQSDWNTKWVFSNSIDFWRSSVWAAGWSFWFTLEGGWCSCYMCTVLIRTWQVLNAWIIHEVKMYIVPL